MMVHLPRNRDVPSSWTYNADIASSMDLWLSSSLVRLTGVAAGVVCRIAASIFCSRDSREERYVLLPYHQLQYRASDDLCTYGFFSLLFGIGATYLTHVRLRAVHLVQETSFSHSHFNFKQSVRCTTYKRHRLTFPLRQRSHAYPK